MRDGEKDQGEGREMREGRKEQGESKRENEERRTKNGKRAKIHLSQALKQRVHIA